MSLSLISARTRAPMAPERLNALAGEKWRQRSALGNANSARSTLRP